MSGIAGRPLLTGRAEGRVLAIPELSLWGAVDPATGVVIDARHAASGECLAGRILVLRRSIGSSSGSAVLLELLRRRRGPAGIVLAHADQVIGLGALVAREMGFGEIPVILVDAQDIERLQGRVRIGGDGTIHPLGGDG